MKKIVLGFAICAMALIALTAWTDKTSSKDLPVKGAIFLSAHESLFQFVPEVPWKKGEYVLLVNPVLEDLAGNNLDRLFDTDLSKSFQTDSKAMGTRVLRFVIK